MPVCDMHEGSGEALSRRALVVGALVSLIGFLTLTLVVTRHGTDGVGSGLIRGGTARAGGRRLPGCDAAPSPRAMGRGPAARHGGRWHLVAGGFAMGLAYLLGAIWLLGSQWGQSARSRNDQSSCGPIHTQKQRTHTSSRMAATESGPTSSVNG